ncbi:lipase 1-like [Topomyia yanbarensis]|uniref:lipase 1-like n=1 Tax=Topomyia yanbarensis TaxID=2498891 RepID=UPI00273BE00A|nr:lipase 1-like [Topomyia yanbarensis]
MRFSEPCDHLRSNSSEFISKCLRLSCDHLFQPLSTMFPTVSILLLFLAFPLVLGGSSNSSTPFLFSEEDALLTVPQLITKYGYEVEEHLVRTEDGYLLTMFRIPARRRRRRKHPVFMMHSLFSSSSEWVLIGRKHGLAYLLANRGYDVWMGNARGTRYSRSHERYSISSSEFWDFSFHEIGFYDIPALVDYVLERTGARRLHYVGFSQGAMACFIALSDRHGLNEKIIEMQALSPAVYMHRSLSVFVKFVVSAVQKLSDILYSASRSEFLPNREKQYFFFQRLCPSPEQTICRTVIYDMVGKNPEKLGVKPLRIFSGHYPAGASMKQALHYAQIIRDGIFRQFDYRDPGTNFQRYGSPRVPRYNLSRATLPVRTYFGYNDHVVNYLNVLQLEQELPNVVGSYPVSDKLFTHFDFVIGSEVKEVLYDEVVRNVEKAERGVF